MPEEEKATLKKPSLNRVKVFSVNLLIVKVKQYPVLHDKQMKGYREKDIVKNVRNAGPKDLKCIESGKSNFVLFFMFYLG